MTRTGPALAHRIDLSTERADSPLASPAGTQLARILAVGAFDPAQDVQAVHRWAEDAFDRSDYYDRRPRPSYRSNTPMDAGQAAQLLSILGAARADKRFVIEAGVSAAMEQLTKQATIMAAARSLFADCAEPEPNPTERARRFFDEAFGGIDKVGAHDGAALYAIFNKMPGDGHDAPAVRAAHAIVVCAFELLDAARHTPKHFIDWAKFFHTYGGVELMKHFDSDEAAAIACKLTRTTEPSKVQMIHDAASPAGKAAIARSAFASTYSG